ncbi:hypothetical protein CHUAL_012025 [Chamberlinius hualienensis]
MTSIPDSCIVDALQQTEDELNGKHKRVRFTTEETKIEKSTTFHESNSKRSSFLGSDRMVCAINDKASHGNVEALSRRPLRGTPSGLLLRPVTLNSKFVDKDPRQKCPSIIRLSSSPNFTSVHNRNELLKNGVIPVQIIRDPRDLFSSSAKVESMEVGNDLISTKNKICPACRALTSNPICEHCRAVVEPETKLNTESTIQPFVTITKIPRTVIVKRRYTPLQIVKTSDKLNQSPVKRLLTRHTINEPPECFTLSSDDESENNSNVKVTPLSSDILNVEESKTATEDVEKKIHNAEIHLFNVEPKDEFVKHVLNCRSIRFGSYKCKAVRLKVTQEYFSVNIPSLAKDNKVVTVNIPYWEMKDFMVHFQINMPFMAFKTSRSFASAIRNRLHMDSQSELYYDPESFLEVRQLIVILPESFSEESISSITSYLLEIDKVKNTTSPLLRKITFEAANAILIKSAHLEKCRGSLSTKESKQESPHRRIFKELSEAESSKIMAVYPLPPLTERMQITTADFHCLNPETCLNDAIIDFYLKYVYFEKLSERDRKRTYIFSSFFYKKLVNSRSASRARLSAGRVSLSSDDHRNRLKGWTKHVDLFEKDFVIIPINQRNHWYLAIICFPALAGEVKNENAEDANTSIVDESAEITEKVEVSVAKKNHQLVSYDYDSDSSNETVKLFSDSLSESFLSEDVEMEDVENKAQEAATSNSEEEQHKIPCIIIFDSLHPRGWSVLASNLREFLSNEWEAKRNTPKVFDKETMKGAYPVVPQQCNYMDCGVYLLQYVESFFENPIKDFRVPICGLENWFSETIIESKRKDIQELILKLSKEQTRRQNDVSVNKSHDVSDNNVGESEKIITERNDVCENVVDEMSSSQLNESESLSNSPVL